jgi:hypothetical protein
VNAAKRAAPDRVVTAADEWRAATGAGPEVKPWEVEGITRRTWYARRAAALADTRRQDRTWRSR